MSLIARIAGGLFGVRGKTAKTAARKKPQRFLVVSAQFSLRLRRSFARSTDKTSSYAGYESY